MDLKSIDLNLLPALEALLDERHVTRAGERLRLTQSAMSGILRRLRFYFGDELLVRSGNVLLLTPLAESLIPLTQEARRSTERLFAIGSEFDPATDTRLFTIAASDYVEATIGPPLSSILTGQAPQVRVDLVPLPVDLLREPQSALLKTDLVILPSTFLQAFQPTSEALFTDDFVCVISADHPSARSGLLQLEDLAAIPRVTASLGLTQQQAIHVGGLQLARSDVAFRAPTMEVSSYLALPSIVRRGTHWAFIPRRLAAVECSSPAFMVFEAPFATEAFSDVMYWHSSRTHDPALTWLRDILRDAANTGSGGSGRTGSREPGSGEPG